MNIDLGNVETTALIPLSNRASETKRENPRVRDQKAVEIIETLGVDTKNYDKLVTHECVIARTIMFDEEMKRLIGEYPNAVCVNMGCGLDNRFERVDNGKIRWFDVGLPMYDAPNAVEELKQPRKHPTPEKVEAIKDALKHFEVI